MRKMKKNCWELKKCDYTLRCPVFSEIRLDGVHGGKNAGRCCWVVAGTLCSGTPIGKYVHKYSDCENCDFYLYVKKEEGQNFSLTGDLLGKLQEK